MSTKMMKLLSANTGLMECKFCGARHHANQAPGGHYRRGSWQCPNEHCPGRTKGTPKVHEKTQAAN
jgi:hypothetical protein